MKYNIITIEREYASGGREIGEAVANRLGLPCYGIEILQMVADKYDVSVENLYELEENTTGSLLYSLSMVSKAFSGNYLNNGLSNTDALYIAEMGIIKELASKGPCVMIGRCAGGILAERKDVLRLFVYSDWEYRKTRAVQKYGIEQKEADSVLRRLDKRRSNYYNAHSTYKWNDRAGYHLMLDSGKLGITSCADIICGVAGEKI